MKNIKLPNFKKYLGVRWLAAAAMISVIVFAGVVVWKFGLIERADNLANLIVGRVSPKSVVEVSSRLSEASEGASIRLHFDILEKDQNKFDQLARKIGLGGHWPKEISVGVSEETTKWLNGLLPISLILTLEGNELTFGNLTLQGLVSSQVKQNYHYATGSGELKLQFSSVNDVNLEIRQPMVLIDEASKSGELYVSPVIGSLEQTINMVDELRLRVNGKRVTGRLQFK